MAQKKATVRKKSTSSTSKSSSRSAAASKKPIRREVGALICFFLAVFGTLGYFKIDAVFINFFSKFLGGMAGWGFYVSADVVCVILYFSYSSGQTCKTEVSVCSINADCVRIVTFPYI